MRMNDLSLQLRNDDLIDVENFTLSSRKEFSSAASGNSLRSLITDILLGIARQTSKPTPCIWKPSRVNHVLTSSNECLNCKGDYQANSNACPFWRHHFNKEWHTKEYQQLHDNRSKLICSVVDSGKIWFLKSFRLFYRMFKRTKLSLMSF